MLKKNQIYLDMYEPLFLEEANEAVAESKKLDEQYHAKTRVQMKEEIDDISELFDNLFKKTTYH